MNSRTLLPGAAIENHTMPPEQRRRILRTRASSALSTANPSRGTASTTTALTSASCSSVSMPLHAQVVGRDVGDHGDVVAVVAEALAQDAAAGHLHHREVDARVLQDHPGRARPGRVGLDDEPLVDDDAVGRGHADLAARGP